MKVSIGLVLMTCAMISCSTQPSGHSGTDNPLESKTDSIVHHHSSEIMGDSTMMGMSLGIYRDGKKYFYNYGRLEKGSSIPPTRHTVYEIGSITKTFTGILLAKAVLEGGTGLEDDVRTRLNEKYENLVYSGEPVRMIHLANHTSGLPEDIIPEALYSLKDPTMFDIIDLFEGDDGAMFLTDLHEAQIETQPGKTVRYSNAGMIVLGIALENTYGISYSQLIRRHIAGPLGMKETETVSFTSDTTSYTKGYDRSGQIMPHITFQIAGAAGGLRSTAHDLVLYIAENIAQNDEAIALSHKLTAGTDDEGMGLGWQIRKGPDGRKQLWHDGGEPGFSSYCLIIPAEKVGIIGLVNQSGRQRQLSILCGDILSELQ